MRGRSLAGTAVIGALWFAACSSDHSALEQKPQGTGGAAGDSATKNDAKDTGQDAPADAVADQFVEPPGEDALTLLHGVVDAPRIAFCFAKVEGGVVGPAQGTPIPPSGLAWGGRIALPTITGLDPSQDDIQPIVIAAANFSPLSGMSCEKIVDLAASYADAGSDSGAADASALDASQDSTDADASVLDASQDSTDASADASDAKSEPGPPPPVRALGLPVLPAGTLGGGYSNLLVATGCMGGPYFTDPVEHEVCGKSYSPSSPTLTAVLVQLSRVSAPVTLGLQVVHAALAADAIEVRSIPPESSSLSYVEIADSVVYGAIVPRPPLLDYSKAAFGNPFPSSSLEVVSSAVYSSTWAAALAAGGLDDVSDGQSYAIVLVGPRPSLTAMKWWNGPRLVVVPTAPKP